MSPHQKTSTLLPVFVQIHEQSNRITETPTIENLSNIENITMNIIENTPPDNDNMNVGPKPEGPSSPATKILINPTIIASLGE